MSIITTDSQYYSNIADAIRSKAGVSDTYKPSEMAPAILSLPTGSGTDVSDTTATAADVLTGKYFYVANGTKTAGTLNFNWMGENPEFVKTVYSLDTTLDKTSFNGWTPSGTAKTIVATTTLTTKETMNLSQYDYIILWISDCQVAYDNTWSPSAGSCMRQISMRTQAVLRRPQDATVPTGVFDYGISQEASIIVYYNKYYTNASTIYIRSSVYSPCYISAITAFTLSSTTADSPQVTIKTPVLAARCNASYFSTGNAEKVDQANTSVKLVGDLYRVKKGTSHTAGTWGIIDNIYNNPL